MQIEKLSAYACYYGSNHLVDLAEFNLVILQPSHYSAKDIRVLRSQNTYPIAYLAVGEEPAAQSTVSWSLIDPVTGLVVRNPVWQTILVDCRSPAWQTYILQQRIPEIIARGFLGIFLDTLDIAEQYPVTRWGVIRLIQQIRSFYPNLFLIGNRGFSILDETIGLLNAFLFESFTTYSINDLADGYAIWDNQALAWTASQVTKLHAMGVKIPLLALDYAASTDDELRRFAIQRARRYGLLPYVTTRLLNWLPEKSSTG